MVATPERVDVIEPADVNFITNQAIPIQISREIEPEITALMSEFGAIEMRAVSALAGAQVGAAISFNMLDPAVIGFITDFSAAKAVGITRTTRRQVALQLAEGIMRGEGIEPMARRLRNKFAEIGTGRARVIARTEVNTAANAARTMAHRQSGLVPRRRWLATRDMRTRDHHFRLNGQIRDINKPFEIPGTGRKAMHPGGFGIPEEDINCRCTTVPLVTRAASRRNSVTDEDDEPLDSDRQTQAEFDARVLEWEIRIERALRRGLLAQERAVLAAAERRDRPAG